MHISLHPDDTSICDEICYGNPPVFVFAGKQSYLAVEYISTWVPFIITVFRFGHVSLFCYCWFLLKKKRDKKPSIQTNQPSMHN